MQSLSLQTKDILYKQGYQVNLFSAFTSTYDDRLENMSNNNKTSTKFEIERIENEEYLKIKFDEYKAETYIVIYMKLLTLNSKTFTSYHGQNSVYLIKCPLLRSPDKYSHASQFARHLSFITLEGDTLLQIQKNWDAILSDFCQSLSTNNSFPPYKSLIAEHHNISKLLLPLYTHPK